MPVAPAASTLSADVLAQRQRQSLRSMGRRLLINMVVCVVIALLIWRFGRGGRFHVALVHSLSIGLLCWMLIDGGRELLARWRHRHHGTLPEWPGWLWFAPVVVVGTLLGMLGGTALAELLLGETGTSKDFRMTIFISVLSSAVASYVFHARENAHVRQLEAEAALRLASETQLKLLQSQLEPHMLFNTLANLRVLIGLDANRAQQMLDQLIRFLRATLAATRVDHHPLTEEFDTLRDYLALMAVRMGPRLQPHFELPDELRQLPLPPLLLQPLVENAIKHGLEPQVDGGRLTVSAQRVRGTHGEQLCLKVRDTGAGLDTHGGPAATAGTSFGLQQVRLRLAAMYGDAAELQLRPALDSDGGTEAVVLLPLPAAWPAAATPAATPSSDPSARSAPSSP